MNPIVVHKYGGSSLASLDKVRAVARRIADTVAAGFRVCAVVSAMGGTTDELLGKAKTLSDNPHPRELDMLLSVGERISTALLAIALDELGLPAVSFTGSQSGIITNARHNRARIVEVRAFRVMDELDAGKVVIVAGYQGVSYGREITTLGRGGTDTTAVALAAALGAEHCEICSDVDGVYTADPRVVPTARRLEAVDHDAMVALARHGSRVLNQDCVQYAARHGVAIFAKSTFGPRDDSGTVVRTNPADDKPAVTALAHRARILEVTLAAGSAGGDLRRLLDGMAAVGAFPVSLSGGGAERPARAVLALDDTHRLGALTVRLQADHPGVTVRSDRGTVTLVGHGLGEEPHVLQTALAIGDELTGGPVDAELGPLALTLTIPEGAVAEAARRLHDALV